MEETGIDSSKIVMAEISIAVGFSIQAQIRLTFYMDSIAGNFGNSYLFISHDMCVVDA